MASAKSVFERAVTSETSPKLSKKASKWDKPKPVPPPAVNREAEDMDQSADCELPPPAFTKNMLAKFQSLQQSDGQLIKDSELNKPRKLWEDELPSDKTSPSPQDAISDDANGDDDDMSVPGHDAEQASGCMEPESDGREVAECDADPQESVEDASEPAADEDESKEEECLISLDDDGADLSGPAAVSDEDATETHVENDEANDEADVPSDHPSPDLVDADAVTSEDHSSIEEASTGEM